MVYIMILKIKIENIGAVITADTCGTAFQKTITVKVNCEMDLESARTLVNEIDAANEWLKYAPKRCKACEHYEDCSEAEK